MSVVRRLITLLVLLLATSVGLREAPALALDALAVGSSTTYGPPAYAYDAPPRSSTQDAVVTAARGASAGPSAAPRVSHVSLARFGVAANTAGPEAATSLKQYVYRIHGGDARPMGHSWTPENPMGMANPRNESGLPKANAGQMLTRARVVNMEGVSTRDALPILEDGVEGGRSEWLLPDPESQLEVHWTIPLVPPW